eukprot:675122-Pyramimonas_sp.AAC.1
MLKYAANQLKTFKDQRQEAVERLASAKEKLHNTYARINVLETQAEGLRGEVDDLNQALTEIDGNIANEMRDLIEQAPMHAEEGSGPVSEAVRVPPSAPPSGPPPRAPQQQHGAGAS